ncbi:ThiF family adenylyltransferase [Leifsonia sp. YIM 134122]|uniref:ThiF family adenylyltransferase n=1 Tax=Leifsonia stereocauli TaxID=3134136 RepID=A0ABU9W9J0_9MICO
MAPSVDPSSRRFARQHVLAGFGLAGQRSLADAHILVIGAGGLGSAVIPALAAVGIGTISLVDPDTVDETNLPRQTAHGVADVGRLKVDSAADAAARLAPDLLVIRHPVLFSTENAPVLLDGVDLVIDGSDSIDARYAANDAAAALGIPLVWGSAVGYGAQVGVAWDAHGIDYRDLFPEQSSDDGDSCELTGVLPMVCGVAGALMAAEAVKLLTGIGEPLLGRVAVYDALTGRTREVPYARDPARGATDAAAAVKSPTSVVPEPSAADSRPRTYSAPELAVALDGANPPALLDVREDWEAAIAELPGSTRIPFGELGARIGELDPSVPVVVYCHLGVRSAHALVFLEQSGFSQASHLAGGIEEWAASVDPGMKRY